MAAADYYNGASTTPQAYLSSPYLLPQQQQQQQQQQYYHSSSPAYTHHSAQQLTHQPPPPYQPVEESHKPSVHFAHSPQPRRPSFSNSPRSSFSNQQRPNPQTWNQPQYPPQSMAPHRPSISYGTPPPQPMYPNPHMRPHLNPNMSQLSLENGGYSSEPEPRRGHRKHREKTRSRDERSAHESSRSATTDSLLGAAGGGLIGDLIFPGLGTIGGAALGWWGGKDYGHHRKWREEKRDREQARWERKYGDKSPERSSDRLDPDPERRRYRRRHSEY